jgi:hypothetical protein
VRLLKAWLSAKSALPRVLIVFDVNGTLATLTKNRLGSTTSARPGIECLRRLLWKNEETEETQKTGGAGAKKEVEDSVVGVDFGLALWSSCMPHNVHGLREILEQASGVKFLAALDRTHTTPNNTYFFIYSSHLKQFCL